MSSYLSDILVVAMFRPRPRPTSKQVFLGLYVSSKSYSQNIQYRQHAIGRVSICSGMQAKKIDEIHAEAHAELGMVPTATLPLFQALPALPASVVGPREEDIELFPAFRGGGALPPWLSLGSNARL